MKEYNPRLNRPLTTAEIDYVVSHIKMMVETTFDWDSAFLYSPELPENATGKLFVPSSAEGWTSGLSINDIPVLFPCSPSGEIYHVLGSNIVFNHDYIKSIFYLLSAYQEIDPNAQRDKYNRFTFKGSIQEQLNIIHTPVVNYYIEWMVKGIEQWCSLNRVMFKRVTVFKSPVLHITHNVRKVNYFSKENIIQSWLQVLGIKPLDMPRKVKLKAAVYATKHAMKLDIIDNPWWTFEALMNIEQQFGFSSSWFFLTSSNDSNDMGDIDINDDDIRHIMLKLGSKGNDIGALLPKMSVSHESISHAISSLQNSYSESLPYSRINLHGLETPEKLHNLESANIMVDCSVHFTDCNGFRNSYCLPFYPFDHENQKVMGILEIPLTTNASNFLKDKVDDDIIFEHAEKVLDEIRKFNGVWSMQWSNADFDSYKFPNSFKLYGDILRYASQYQTTSATTTDVVRRIISISEKLF